MEENSQRDRLLVVQLVTGSVNISRKKRVEIAKREEICHMMLILCSYSEDKKRGRFFEKYDFGFFEFSDFRNYFFRTLSFEFFGFQEIVEDDFCSSEAFVGTSPNCN